MEIKTEIAKTRFEFSGAIDLAQVNKSLKLKAAVAGDRLDSLKGFLNIGPAAVKIVSSRRTAYPAKKTGRSFRFYSPGWPEQIGRENDG